MLGFGDGTQFVYCVLTLSSTGAMVESRRSYNITTGETTHDIEKVFSASQKRAFGWSICLVQFYLPVPAKEGIRPCTSGEVGGCIRQVHGHPTWLA